MKLTHQSGRLWRLEAKDNPSDFIWVQVHEGSYSFAQSIERFDPQPPPLAPQISRKLSE